MKKFVPLFLSVIFGASLTVSCSSDISDSPLLTAPDNSGNTAIMSAKGLTSIYDLMLKKGFEGIDKNHNGSINLEEYKASFPPVSVNPTPPSSVPAEPPVSVEPSAAPATEINASQIVANTQQDRISTDPATRFAKIDSNKDGKLTLTEVRAKPNYFSPYFTKDGLRTGAKSYFTSLDTNKNKYISQSEYARTTEFVTDQNQKAAYVTLFNVADINKDNQLSFSEYEDLLYGSIKTYLTMPAAPPSPVPVPAPYEPSPSGGYSDPYTPPSQTPVQPAPAQP